MIKKAYLHITFLELVKLITINNDYVMVDHPKLPHSQKIYFKDIINANKLNQDHVYFLFKKYSTFFGMIQHQKLYVLESIKTDDPSKILIDSTF